MQRVQLFMRAAGLAAAFTVASAGLHAQAPATARTTGNTASVSSDDTTFAQRAAESGVMEVR
jgi:hypothetical protein